MASVVQQRPLRGSRISTFYPVKNLPSLASLDSAFQLQEYISLLIRLDVHDVDTIVSVPGKSNGKEKERVNGADEEGSKTDSDAEKERRSEVAVDEACWIYEQLRRLAQDLSHPLITMLQQECTRASCPEMKAGEWLYLCVAHGEDGAREQCCAIDYILHTLDSATALLNSPRAFPSRLSILQTSHRHFSSLARRLGRIFAHAYFHHRETFEQAEAESSLYARFLALTSKFDLVPAEFLVIPSRVNPLDGRGEPRRDVDVQPPRLLAAAIDPQGERERDRLKEQELFGPDWEHVNPRSIGRSPPGLGHESGRESPRKFGRNRTDTMVFSEAVNVVEELAKVDGYEVDVGQDVQVEAGPSVPVLAHRLDELLSPSPSSSSSSTSASEQTIDLSSAPEELSAIEIPNPPAAIAAADIQLEDIDISEETSLPDVPSIPEELSPTVADSTIPEMEIPSSDQSLPERVPSPLPAHDPRAEYHELSDRDDPSEGPQSKPDEIVKTEDEKIVETGTDLILEREESGGAVDLTTQVSGSNLNSVANQEPATTDIPHTVELATPPESGAIVEEIKNNEPSTEAESKDPESATSQQLAGHTEVKIEPLSTVDPVLPAEQKSA